eukprot:scaffold69126_cov23-Cyclotella_meneghiniana.AAC.2
MASCKLVKIVHSTDAEMRVYCVYPAMVLLFGGENWEADNLKGATMGTACSVSSNHVGIEWSSYNKQNSFNA